MNNDFGGGAEVSFNPKDAGDNETKALGKAIGDARRAANMTQQELCLATGLSYSTLAKVERGAIKTPSVFTVLAVANATGMSVEELVSGRLARPLGDNLQASKSGIKFVYFDVNGVLVRFFHHAFSQLAQDTGASATSIESTFWHYNDAVCRGEMSVTEFNRALAKHIGKHEVDWLHYYMDAVTPITEIQDMLKQVSKSLKVGLLTNIMPGFIKAMTTSGLIPNIDYAAVIDSSTYGAIKPEAKLYEIAQQEAGVKPEEILLIDDSRTNLMSAERMGWKVLWFDDYTVDESVKRIEAALEL